MNLASGNFWHLTLTLTYAVNIRMFNAGSLMKRQNMLKKKSVIKSSTRYKYLSIYIMLNFDFQTDIGNIGMLSVGSFMEMQNAYTASGDLK